MVQRQVAHRFGAPDGGVWRRGCLFIGVERRERRRVFPIG
ncbi:hypothetical protein BSIN_0431 [Burkholderia singularis]|uniref:Uncharacterized protein n=1 Tax=Burkholderia singularis TaxID=1503053 RepID=A0A238H5X3_9BURK|nr:hypothetical protein BSIN_0431 [Burkholderia singularis]